MPKLTALSEFAADLEAKLRVLVAEGCGYDHCSGYQSGYVEHLDEQGEVGDLESEALSNHFIRYLVSELAAPRNSAPIPAGPPQRPVLSPELDTFASSLETKALQMVEELNPGDDGARNRVWGYLMGLLDSMVDHGALTDSTRTHLLPEFAYFFHSEPRISAEALAPSRPMRLVRG